MDKYISLEDYVTEVLEREKNAKEIESISTDIHNVAEAIYNVALSNKKVHILTDYDADGITSAYEVRSILQAVNPNTNIEITPNDRRNSYGVPKEIRKEDNTAYIVLDTGCNELSYLYETFGKENIIMLDHHLIEDPLMIEEIKANPNLINPKAYLHDDGKYSEYCTAGLALRVYENVKEIALKNSPEMIFGNSKTENTIRIMGAVGTMADCVDVNDIHSYNRKIVKDGMNAINNADEYNTDFLVGSLLSLSGIGMDDIISTDISFSVAPVINATSRLSELHNENGAKRLIDALTSDSTQTNARFELIEMCNRNAERKSIINKLQNDENYINFINDNRLTDSNIVVYECPKGTPHALVGIIAGKLAESIDKAVVACVYNENTLNYTGSVRSTSLIQDSLKNFFDNITNSDEAKNLGLEITYGGHDEAMGISSCNNLDALKTLVEKHSTELNRKQDNLYFKPFDINSESNLKLLKSIDPLPKDMPKLLLIGKESYRNAKFKSDNPRWKTVKINLVDEDRKQIKNDNGKSVVYEITDWNYNSSNYPLLPPSDKKGENTIIKVYADVSISTYKSLHIEPQAKFNRELVKECYKELGVDVSKFNKTPKLNEPLKSTDTKEIEK